MLLFKFKFLSFLTDQLTHLHQRRWSWTEPQWRTWKPREGRRIWWQQVLDIEDICGFARAKKRWIHIGEEFCKMMILFALASSLHSPHKLLCVDFTVLEEKKQFDEKVKVCARTWKEKVIVYARKRKGDLRKRKWIWVGESGWETVKVDMKKVKRDLQRWNLNAAPCRSLRFLRFGSKDLSSLPYSWHTSDITLYQ